MSWMTFKSGESLFHLNMDNIETIRVDMDKEGRAEKVNFFFTGDDDPSLKIEEKDGSVDAVAKSVEEYLASQKGRL